MGNRCREGSLGKNNLPQSFNDHTHGDVTDAFVTVCLCVLVESFLWLFKPCVQPNPQTYLLTDNVCCRCLWGIFHTSLTNIYSICVLIWRHTAIICFHYKWFSFLYISGRRGALSSWYVISGRAVQSRTLYSPLPARWGGVLLQYGSNIRCDGSMHQEYSNAQNMPWIIHRLCSPAHMGSTCSWEMGSFQLSKFKASTSIIAVNVRTCLCLCNCLVCTPMPCIVRIN